MAEVPYWGIPTASVDWCEKNYEVCAFIAEFWNTLTSGLIALYGLVGCYLTFRERLEHRFTFLYFIIVLVGLGSVAFHGTLQLEYQLLDELPMLWGMMGWIYVIKAMESPNKQTQEDKRLVRSLSVAGVAWSLAAPWIHFYWPVVFQAVFVLLVLFCLYHLHKYYRQCKNPTARRLYVIYNFSVAVGAILWLIDKEACNILHEVFGQYWWHQYVGSFHGYWHTLMAANVYVGPVFAATMRTQILEIPSAIHWWGGVFPYVKLQIQRVGQKSE
jgi:dihydroceramidase